LKLGLIGGKINKEVGEDKGKEKDTPRRPNNTNKHDESKEYGN